jgi:hypothetical protein
VVAAYHARVVGSSIAAPVPPRFGQKRAEWLGSSTGPEKPPGECKQAAEWSFTLGCEFTVTSGQLSVFEHPEPARALQPPDRLSHPLVLEVAAPAPPAVAHPPAAPALPPAAPQRPAAVRQRRDSRDPGGVPVAR